MRCTWSYTYKKNKTNPILGNQEWERRDKEMVTEHVLTCHRDTTLNSIALLSTSGPTVT
jgi:hypothetical protein